jgi:hypothetical protein
MTIDELLHETAPDGDRVRHRTAALRTEVLARATSRNRPRSRRPLRVGLAAAVVATVGVTGVAYATGSVPAYVTSVVDDFGRDTGVAPADRPAMAQILDLELPDGSRFAAWAGWSDEMWCTAYTDNWDGQSTGSGGAGCGDGAADRELNRQHIAWARNGAGTTYYPVLFGQARAGETTVRVTGTVAGTGEQVDLTVPVDTAKASFGAVLPGTVDHPWDYLEDPAATLRDSGVTLEFRDAAGAVTRTVDDLYA